MIVLFDLIFLLFFVPVRLCIAKVSFCAFCRVYDFIFGLYATQILLIFASYWFLAAPAPPVRLKYFLRFRGFYGRTSFYFFKTKHFYFICKIYIARLYVQMMTEMLLAKGHTAMKCLCFISYFSRSFPSSFVHFDK